MFCFWKLAQLGGPGLVVWEVAVRALAGAGSPVVLKVMVVHWYFADYVFGSGAVICSRSELYVVKEVQWRCLSC